MHLTLLTLSVVVAQIQPIQTASGNPAVERGIREAAQAARQFRRSVYENYRTDRPEFDRRWKAGEELWRHWIAIEQPAAHREAVIGWFHEAARLAVAGDRGPLPDLPTLPEPSLPTLLRNGHAPLPAAETPAIELPLESPDVPPSVNASEGKNDAPTGAAPSASETAPSADKRNAPATGPSQIHSLLKFTESLIKPQSGKP